MIRMTEADLQQGLGALAERARHEPVTITKDGRDDLVVLSAEEYARLQAARSTGWAYRRPPGGVD